MSEQVSVILTSDISYVYGTVNGVEATFILTAENTWTATVEKTLSGKYAVSITAYNNLGTATNYSTVIFKLEGLIPLKLNWTREDYYSAEDFNRVEADTQYIAEYLKSMGYSIPELTIRADRDISFIDFISSVSRVEDNIQSIKEAFITPIGWQDKRVWTLSTKFDFRDANRLESNLNALYSLANIVKDNLIYCGTFSLGTEWEGGLF
jgi:hypothetical protein